MTVKRKHGGNILRVSGGLAGDDPCCCEGSCLGYPACLTGRTGTLVISGLVSSPVLSVNCCIPYSHLGPPNTTVPANITEQLTNANINGSYAMTYIGGGQFAWFEPATSPPFSIEIARTVDDYLACGALFDGASSVLTKCWLIQVRCRVACSDNNFILNEVSFLGTICRSTNNGATWSGPSSSLLCGSYDYDPVTYCSDVVATSTPGGCLFPCTASHTHEVRQTYFTSTHAGNCDYINFDCSSPSDLTASLTIT